MKTHLIIPDTHSSPGQSFVRFDFLGQLIADVKPDVVVHLGDHFDFNSLSSYETGRRAFNGRNYGKDIDQGLEAFERMFRPIRRSKRRMPRRVFLWGNHEQRLVKAINLQPELEGDRFGISERDMSLERYFNDIVPYEGTTPGLISIDSITYSHYFISGNMGRPIGGEHVAYSLITKQFGSCTCGHIHTLDFSVRTAVNGRKLMGLCAGVFQDHRAEWAGAANDNWWSGVVIKRAVDNGTYDPQFVSMKQLEKVYGR